MVTGRSSEWTGLAALDRLECEVALLWAAVKIADKMFKDATFHHDECNGWCEISKKSVALVAEWNAARAALGEVT